jgi:prepilin-type N-terminal cleavage/methylation domain-containing protein
VTPPQLTTPPRPATHPRAFTLVELLAALAILAVLSIASIPALARLSDSRRLAAAAQCARDLTYARERALATGLPTYALFNTTSSTLAILQEDPASRGRAGALTITDPATGEPFLERLGSGPYAGASITAVSFDGATEVGFDRLGRPTRTNGTPTTNTGTVAFGTGLTVTLAPRTGHVAVVTTP